MALGMIRIALDWFAVIPDASKASNRESRIKIAGRRRWWIPDQAFGLPGMTGPSELFSRKPYEKNNPARSVARGGQSAKAMLDVVVSALFLMTL